MLLCYAPATSAAGAVGHMTTDYLSTLVIYHATPPCPCHYCCRCSGMTGTCTVAWCPSCRRCRRSGRRSRGKGLPYPGRRSCPAHPAGHCHGPSVLRRGLQARRRVFGLSHPGRCSCLAQRCHGTNAEGKGHRQSVAAALHIRAVGALNLQLVMRGLKTPLWTLQCRSKRAGVVIHNL